MGEGERRKYSKDNFQANTAYLNLFLTAGLAITGKVLQQPDVINAIGDLHGGGLVNTAHLLSYLSIATCSLTALAGVVRHTHWHLEWHREEVLRRYVLLGANIVESIIALNIPT